MLEPNTLRKLRALKNLAESEGSEYERVSAQTKLNELLVKYDISTEELNEEPEPYAEFGFYVTSAHEKKVLFQLLSTYVGSVLPYTGKDHRKWKFWLPEKIGEAATEAYAIHRAALKKQMALVTKAYVHKNDLFPSESIATPVEMSAEDLAMLISLLQAFEPTSMPITKERRLSGS